MSLLKNFETKIEGLLEGTFGRVFRSQVRPIELARKLVKEMDQHCTVSVMRTFAPHEYDVWLSLQDRDHYEGVEGEVIDELCAYLLEHARREQLTLAGRPSIRLHTDDGLQLGEFAIETHPVRLDEDEEPIERGQPEALPASEAASFEPDDLNHTMLYSGSKRLREPLERAQRLREPGAMLIVAGRRIVLPPSGGVIGRSRDCDAVIEDGGVSRRHAQVRPGPEGWTIEDLGSTNGVRVGGRPVRGAVALRSGDRIELGSTKVVFELR